MPRPKAGAHGGRCLITSAVPATLSLHEPEVSTDAPSPEHEPPDRPWRAGRRCHCYCLRPGSGRSVSCGWHRHRNNYNPGRPDIVTTLPLGHGISGEELVTLGPGRRGRAPHDTFGKARPGQPGKSERLREPGHRCAPPVHPGADVARQPQWDRQWRHPGHPVTGLARHCRQFRHLPGVQLRPGPWPRGSGQGDRRGPGP